MSSFKLHQLTNQKRAVEEGKRCRGRQPCLQGPPSSPGQLFLSGLQETFPLSYPTVIGVLYKSEKKYTQQQQGLYQAGVSKEGGFYSPQILGCAEVFQGFCSTCSANSGFHLSTYKMVAILSSTHSLQDRLASTVSILQPSNRVDSSLET